MTTAFGPQLLFAIALLLSSLPQPQGPTVQKDAVHQLVQVVLNPNEPTNQRISAARALIGPGQRIPPDSVQLITAVALSSKEDPVLRSVALDALATTGADAAPAVPSLCLFLADRDQVLALRQGAARAIGAISSAATIGFPVEALAAVLGNRGENVDLRREVARSLGDLREAARKAIPTLEVVVVNKAEPRELRLDVFNSLRSIAQGTQALAGDLTKIFQDTSEDLGVRIEAAKTLALVGADEHSIKILTDDVNDAGMNVELRRAAIMLFISQVSAAKEAANTLLTILKDSKQDTELRRYAAQALASAKAGSPDDVKVIIDILQNRGEPVQVRQMVASFAGSLGAQAAGAIPAVVQIVTDSDEDLVLRRSSGDALMQIRPHGTSAVATLRPIVYDRKEDIYLRRRITWVLGRIGSDDRSTDPQVISILLDVLNSAEDSDMRTYALAFLGQLDPGRTNLILNLIQTALNPQEDVNIKRQAIAALGNVGRDYSVAEAVPGLLQILESNKEQTSVRQSVAQSLAMIRTKPRAAVPILERIVQDPAEEAQFRSSVATTLGAIGEESPSVVSVIAGVVADKNQNQELRMASMWALGKMGAAAGPYLNLLLQALNDPDMSIQSNALGGLTNFVETVSADGATESLKDANRVESAVAAAIATTPVLGNQTENGVPDLNRIHGARISLQRQSSAAAVRMAVNFVLRHLKILIAIAVVPLWYLYTTVLLWTYPLGLITVSEAFSRYGKTQFNILRLTLTGDQLPIYLFSRYPRRALDKWVSRHASAARSNFENIPKVRDRKDHVSLPVRIGDSIHKELSPKDLHPIFGRQRCCILVTGEGGIGKTSLACQIGEWSLGDDSGWICGHRMLPIFIDGDINLQVEQGEDVFIEVIRGSLMRLIDHTDAPSSSMVASLLKNQCLLVIVDGFSEMTDLSRQRLQFISPRFPVNALLLTSRLDEDLQTIEKTIVAPQRLDGSCLSFFVERYLERKGKSELFPGRQLHELCGELQTTIADRDITPLLAKLYVDNSVAFREERNGVSKPRNIPDIFLEYLNQLNRAIPTARLDDAKVHQIAKVVAFECVRQDLRPAHAEIRSVQSALSRVGASEEDLRYLCERLCLIDVVSPGDRIQFGLDPLAEYLAALHLVDRNERNETKWRNFLGRLDEIPNSATVGRGFLQAVADCYLLKYPDPPLDDFFAMNILPRVRP